MYWFAIEHHLVPSLGNCGDAYVVLFGDMLETC